MFNRFIILSVLFLISCADTEKKSAHRYIDLKDFFNKEAVRLHDKKAAVDKTVSRNGVAESKNNIVPEWNTELNLFIESDINKPAWTDAYSIKNISGGIQYIALDPKLRTRSIKILKDKNGRMKELVIINSAKNNLYTSSEELKYIPDSIYSIIKNQQVILLGDNRYEIMGIFN